MSGAVWPGGAPFAVCPTHDVDRIHKFPYHYLYYGVTGGVRSLWRQIVTLGDHLVGRDSYWNFELIMELETRLGVRSTFLFLNESARGSGPEYWGRYDVTSSETRRIVQDLDSGGWEIGLHGSYHSYRDLSLLAREKAVLEGVLGKAVVSTRQHYLNLKPGQTWKLQRAVGLRVDSTVGYSDRIWDAADGVWPYYPDDSGVLELPITVMDTAGLEKSRVRASVDRLIEQMSAAGGLIVLDWHQRSFNPREYPERVTIYATILERAKSRGAWIAPMREIAGYWNLRSGRS